MTNTSRNATRKGVSDLARRAVSFELGVWRSLYRWIARRPRVPDADAYAFSYVRAVAPIMWTFIGVSAIEVPVFHLVVPWDIVRIIGLAVGIWGLTWMLGLLGSLHVHPHVVGDDGLRVRYGTTIDIMIPWEAITTIKVQRRDLPSSRTVRLSRTGSGTALSIGITSQTNVHVALRRPRTVLLPKGSESVTEVRFYVDDPHTLVARARGD